MTRRKDAVPAAVALAVLHRDGGCIAPRLGGSFMDCWGRNRLEHLKVQLRMGVRAESCECRLLTLCEGHTEPGMKAGYIWCTDRVNRAAMRDHLRTMYPDHEHAA